MYELNVVKWGEILETITDEIREREKEELALEITLENKNRGKTHYSLFHVN
ncbi:MAG: hypothetical protein AB2693_11505 [Candidatus Thiodiazotropha sp.]